jgi:hypothetical protein
MLNRLKKYGINLAGSIFNADSSYDGEKQLQVNLYMMNMFPNIRQRINANRNKGRNRKYRKKASEIFNISLYHYRGLIEKEYLELRKQHIIISYIADSD